MSYPHEARAVEDVVAQAARHIGHHGGLAGDWYVGIEEKGSDRDSRNDRCLMNYLLASEDDAKTAMSRLLDRGLQADDEYGAEPTILFIYTRKKKAA
ncbi:hypothetical protein DND132_0557 [Pseudodesulfovibrio mercurii]|uniref:Uncharacterized protein n=1 Tax=Pseudodesulfovibrio mercurii TaxID=641491 RepID=F0JFU5_9BACT|nr:hypothetical protein [Pseudodesulfovibrio mercurii]EGB13773.1 hypothetical protein DND132_0557 [Pseudodesulfovibrio mercurii]